MTQFYSLVEGLKYVQCCPLCHQTINFWGDVATVIHGINDWSVVIKIDQNEIEVDLETNRITRITNKDNKDPLSPYFTHPSSRRMSTSKIHWPLPNSGFLYTPLTKNCQNCNRYCMILQLKFDMGVQTLNTISLNTEHLYFTDMNPPFSICNNYINDKTEFNKIDSTDEDITIALATLDLPLIPLDHNDVNTFVRRVKNLLIYS